MNLRRGVGFVSFALAAWGCGSVLDLAPLEFDSEDASASMDASTPDIVVDGGETVPSDATANDTGVVMPTCEGECIPQLADWEGPFPTRLDAALDAGADCPSGGVTGYAGFKGGTGTCESCPPSVVETRRTCAYRLQMFADDDCATVPSELEWSSENLECHNIPNTPKSVMYAGVIKGTGSCSAATTTFETLPKPSWGSKTQSCSMTGTACSPSCIKPATLAGYPRVCLRREGEETCPSSLYTDRHVVHHRFDDQRKCACVTTFKDRNTCATAGESGPVLVADCFTLNPANYENEPASVCIRSKTSGLTQPNAGFKSFYALENEMGAASCTVASTITGDAGPADAITYCCIP